MKVNSKSSPNNINKILTKDTLMFVNLGKIL